MARNTANSEARRFGIGEWYGMSFVSLSGEERRELATRALSYGGKGHGTPCPFRNANRPMECSKKGGVCSLRLYRRLGCDAAEPVTGPEGSLRVVCPHRFKQEGLVYRVVGEAILGTPTPRVVGEVRFLQREHGGQAGEDTSGELGGSDEAGRSEDVGNIDAVLVHPSADPLRWCALEIQAVYFSGKGMPSLFRMIQSYDGPGIPFPDAVRRPDYRSSGPKRLMPQLQIKVPTLRRWGKKMAVVVDASFYRNLGKMETVLDMSNADIAWFVVDFDESGDAAHIVMGEPYKQTLERAVEGLTGGTPVSLPDFEAKIREKLAGGIDSESA